MGYMINQRGADFAILRENFEPALAAIHAIPRGSVGYSWTGDFYSASTLQAALADWRWETFTTTQGDIGEIEFDGEKAGDDDVLFRAIAPFVVDGSWIEMQGEEGEVWRWVFRNGQFEEHYARLVFDYEGADDE